jgi:hypothetical protein
VQIAIDRGERPARTFSVATADVYAFRDGKETHCAMALATIRNFEINGS